MSFKIFRTSLPMSQQNAPSWSIVLKTINMQNIETFFLKKQDVNKQLFNDFPNTSHYNINAVYIIKNTSYTKLFKQNNLKIELNSYDENWGFI